MLPWIPFPARCPAELEFRGKCQQVDEVAKSDSTGPCVGSTARHRPQRRGAVPNRLGEGFRPLPRRAHDSSCLRIPLHHICSVRQLDGLVAVTLRSAPGDTTEAEISGIGTLKNYVVAES